MDSQTGLVVKTWTYEFSPLIVENRTLVETQYSDYRFVQGQLIPFHSVRFVAGQKFSEITLATVQLGAGIADGEFQLR